MDPATADAHRRHAGSDLWFCSEHCARRFDLDPPAFVPPEVIDPVCGMAVDPAAAAATAEHGGRSFHFCSAGCAAAFDADPARYIGAAAPGAH